MGAVSAEGGHVIRLLIVDDHPIWRDAVERDLVARGYEVVGAATSAGRAVEVAKATRPDVVVMDLQLGTDSGVDATAEIVAALPDTRVLVLSASGEPPDVLAAVKNGASGYLVKSASLDELDDAIRRTAEGDAVFSPGLAGLLLGEYRRLQDEPATEGPVLTERETEVLRLVARGLSARQVASRLVISHRTVENHVQNTLRKLQLHNRAELVRYALEHGLDDVDDGD